MTFTPKKYKDIFDEMRAMSQVVTDFEVGSVARTLYESFSYELALVYEKMQMVYLSAYVDTAQGNQLDQVVAVLGITRNQPDFAEGVVSFQRDGAGLDIFIPAGTLVATKESSTGEKHVYQTTKEATLTAVRTSVDVRIRAVERGEEFETAAGTLSVMPRPVPGIKSITNADPIRLVGKRRESDDELRDRAKNTLISSGKATILSIENTLLSLPGVRDARVRENFHFSRADVRVTLQAAGAGNAIIIPRGTRLIAQPGGISPPFPSPFPLAFRTMEMVSIAAIDPAGTTYDTRIECLVEGRLGEIPTTTGIILMWDDGLLANQTSISLQSPAKLEDFGLIEVYVDAPRLESGTTEERATEADRLNAAIDTVRAAGIFAVLRPTVKAKFSAVFRIDIAASLNLSAEERRAFEEAIEDQVVSFISDLRMGEALLYGKLIREVLSIDNVDNLTDFKGQIVRMLNLDAQIAPIGYADAEKAIRVEEFERIEARHICVATEDKDLKLHIAYHSPALDASLAASVASNLGSTFATAPKGVHIVLQDVLDIIEAVIPVPDPATFEVRPETWCPGPADDPRPLFYEEFGMKKIEVTFVERPTLGIIFGYNQRLEVDGAIKLVLPLNISNADTEAVVLDVQAAVAGVLQRLGPEEDITFEALIAAAQSVDQVLAAEIDPDDFACYASGSEVPNIVDKKKIDVPELMRAFTGHLLVSPAISTLSVAVTGITVKTASLSNTQAIQDALLIAWNNLLNGFAPGDEVPFTALKSGLENLVPGIPYTIANLSITATNATDGRQQTRDLASNAPFHTRSIEQPKVLALSANLITVTL